MLFALAMDSVVELCVVSHLDLLICPYFKSRDSSLLLFLPLVSPQKSTYTIKLADIVC